MLWDGWPGNASRQRKPTHNGFRPTMVRRPHATDRCCRMPVCLGGVCLLLLMAVGLCGVTTAVPAGSREYLPQRIDGLLRDVEAGAPSPLCSDSEFIRRLSIDLLGALPMALETRRFLADPSPHKRSYLVGRLLDHPRSALHMARSFDVMLLERRNTEGIKQEDWERYLF